MNLKKIIFTAMILLIPFYGFADYEVAAPTITSVNETTPMEMPVYAPSIDNGQNTDRPVSDVTKYYTELNFEFSELENTFAKLKAADSVAANDPTKTIKKRLEEITIPMDNKLSEFKFVMTNDQPNSFVDMSGVEKSGISRLLAGAGISQAEHEKMWREEYNKINKEYRNFADVLRRKILENCKDSRSDLENQLQAAANEVSTGPEFATVIDSYKSKIQKLYQSDGLCFDVPPQYDPAKDKILASVLEQNSNKQVIKNK